MEDTLGIKDIVEGGVRKAETVIIPAKDGCHTATVIMLHGAASSGYDFEKWIEARLGRKLDFPHIKSIYPTAKAKNCSLASGAERNVWFDLDNISPLAPEDLEGINNRCIEIERVIDREIRRGIKPERIVVIGFSMGGILAQHVGLRRRRDIAGVGVLGAFLNIKSLVYKSLAYDKPGKTPSLYWLHGEQDMVARCRWGKKTFDRLSDLGVTGEFFSYDGMQHDMCKEQLQGLEKWILNILP